LAAKLKLKFDLVDIIRSITDDKRKLQVYLPLVSNNDFKREYGKRLIDDIEARLDEGKDKDGDAMKGYSNSYKKSELFKFWDKDKTVNLQLTGQMRTAMDVISTAGRSVTIGFIDQEANDKAHGHINGANYLPVRDFWGVPNKSQTDIMKDMIREFSERETILVDIPEVSAEADFGFEVDLTDGE
jgi:hypothetical protein